MIGCRSNLELFWVKFQSSFGLGLVLRNFCIKEMMKFQRQAVLLSHVLLGIPSLREPCVTW